MTFLTPRYLSPVSTVSTRNAWDYDDDLARTQEKKTVVSLESRSSKASSTNWNSRDAIFHGAWLDALYSMLKKLRIDKNLQAGKRLKNNKDD